MSSFNWNNFEYIKDKCALVDHYYYKEWPDKDCPSEAQSIIVLHQRINKKYCAFDSPPILIHCRWIFSILNQKRNF